VGYIGNATLPYLGELEPVDGWCIVGEGGMSLENPHDVVGHVSYNEILLQPEFDVFSRNLEGNLLFLLGDCIIRW